MERYWEANGVQAAPQAPNISSGYYPTDGNLVSGQAPSTPGAWWFHMITEEIRAVLVAAGVSPDFTDLNQLLTAIENLITTNSLSSIQIQQLIERHSHQSVQLIGSSNSYTGEVSPAVTTNTAISEAVTVFFPTAITGVASINLGGGATPLVDARGVDFSADSTIPSGNSIVQYNAELKKFQVLGLGGIDQVARNHATAAQTDATDALSGQANDSIARNAAAAAQNTANEAYPATNPENFISSVAGLGFGGTVWHSVSRAFNTQYTNPYPYPIAVSATASCAVSSAIQAIVNGQQVAFYVWQFNGCGSNGGTFIIVPPGANYQLNSSQSVQNWVELY